METGIERHAIGRHLDRASIAALLVNGLTHDLFLETGVLLVVKLILNTYHMEVHASRLEERIEDVHELLRTLARDS